MTAVKSTGSKIETTLAKSLFARGHRYRKNDKTVFGKPDLTFKRLKIAIFVDSEFWHGKNWETKKFDLKTNKEFWLKKIERNIARDKEVNLQLLKDDWAVLRIWGSVIMKDIDGCVKAIEKLIHKRERELNYGKFK